MSAGTNDALDFRLDDLVSAGNCNLLSGLLGETDAEDEVASLRREFASRVGYPPSGINRELLEKVNSALGRHLMEAQNAPFLCRRVAAITAIRLYGEILAIYHF